MENHNEKEKEFIAKMKAKKILRIFKTIIAEETMDGDSVLNYISKQCSIKHQELIIISLKKHDIKDELEFEVLKQINKL